MFARVATFENRDMSRVDELVEIVRSRAVSGNEVPEAVRHDAADPRGRSALGVTFFESEEALRPRRLRSRGSAREILRRRSRRTSVTSAIGDRRCDGATRSARVASLTCAICSRHCARPRAGPGRADEPEAGRTSTLVDRTTGVTKTITFWESDDALRRFGNATPLPRRRVRRWIHRERPQLRRRGHRRRSPSEPAAAPLRRYIVSPRGGTSTPNHRAGGQSGSPSRQLVPSWTHLHLGAEAAHRATGHAAAAVEAVAGAHSRPSSIT
jgi:hypothetical protein